jgi:hypothetical protein
MGAASGRASPAPTKQEPEQRSADLREIMKTESSADSAIFAVSDYYWRTSLTGRARLMYGPLGVCPLVVVPTYIFSVSDNRFASLLSNRTHP